MAFDYSVKFELKLENYANAQLYKDKHVVESGIVTDRQVDILAGQYEVMTGHKTWLSATGCGGVVSWNIVSWNIVHGDKMLVVMYDVPYDHLWYENTLAIGIFPQGNIKEYYNKMYYDVENGFKRATFGKSIGVLCYKGDTEYYIEATMDEQHDPSIQV